jgi:hypothetical protein
MEADIAHRFEGMRAASIESVQALVTDLVRLGAGPSRARTSSELDALYVVANDIVGLSAVASCEELGQASLCLCRLVDGFRNGKAWNGSAFDVTVKSIALMAQKGAELDKQGLRATVAGLSTVIAKALG